MGQCLEFVHALCFRHGTLRERNRFASAPLEHEDLGPPRPQERSRTHCARLISRFHEPQSGGSLTESLGVRARSLPRPCAPDVDPCLLDRIVGNESRCKTQRLVGGVEEARGLADDPERDE